MGREEGGRRGEKERGKRRGGCGCACVCIFLPLFLSYTNYKDQQSSDLLREVLQKALQHPNRRGSTQFACATLAMGLGPSASLQRAPLPAVPGGPWAFEDTSFCSNPEQAATSSCKQILPLRTPLASARLLRSKPETPSSIKACASVLRSAAPTEIERKASIQEPCCEFHRNQAKWKLCRGTFDWLWEPLQFPQCPRLNLFHK